MNCRAAQRLLSAERDGALATGERAELETHVAACADCRQARAAVAGAIESWRTSAARIDVPDAQRAWQDIRRELRADSPARSRAGFGVWRWAVPFGAAAALAVAVWAPRSSSRSEPVSVARMERASAEFVEVSKDSSSVIYVDDKSGWLVVWADDAGTKTM